MCDRSATDFFPKPFPNNRRSRGGGGVKKEICNYLLWGLDLSNEQFAIVMHIQLYVEKCIFSFIVKILQGLSKNRDLLLTIKSRFILSVYEKCIFFSRSEIGQNN